MCGIVSIASNENCIPDIISGLKSLEYRGYDSSGIAIIKNNKLEYKKSVGKINNLEAKIKNNNLSSVTAIGHTRWATHGRPSMINAHPFVKKSCALVHNGIIENYEDIIKHFDLSLKNIKSDTDTEIIAEAYDLLLKKTNSPLNSLNKLISKIKGSFAFSFLIKNNNSIYAARRGSPLVIGLSKNLNSLSSDVLGLTDKINKIIFLEEGDIAEINKDYFQIFNKKLEKVKREIHDHSNLTEYNTKGNFKHFMQKEIYHQPTSLEDTVLNFLEKKTGKIYLPNLKINFNNISNINLVACGTAFHACMIGKYWIEYFSNIPVYADIGSEYRYRDNILSNDTLGIAISQSGETMDTLECLKKLKKNNIYSGSIVNVISSSIARESNFILPTLAGPEIGVASTKAFTSQLIVLALFSRYAQQEKNIKIKKSSEIFNSLFNIQKLIKKVLLKDKKINEISKILKNSKSIFYIGRGTMYPLALEGALKLKEITYKHCEGYAAGELKHGPLALIERNIPVIVLAPFDNNFSKVLSNIQEIKAREGKIILITDLKGSKKAKKFCDEILILPNTNFITAPIVYSIPIQIIAYHLGVQLGTDVDQPRNLAKSVTVE